MSDKATTKRQRAPINALKIINQLRDEKGLPRISNKPKAVRITPELKKEITRQELLQLYPEALTTSHYEFSEAKSKELVKRVEDRLARIKLGQETAPEVESAAPRKTRGRPRKA